MVRLEQGDYQAGEGNSRAVERVDELGLAALFLEADLAAPGLEVEEIAARADLEPALLGRSPQLDVVALGVREAHLARA